MPILIEGVSGASPAETPGGTPGVVDSPQPKSNGAANPTADVPKNWRRLMRDELLGFACLLLLGFGRWRIVGIAHGVVMRNPRGHGEMGSQVAVRRTAMAVPRR